MSPIEYVASRVTNGSIWLLPDPDEDFHDYVRRTSGSLSVDGTPHFRGREMLTLRRAGLVAPIPPRKMWPRIVPALWLAEQCRHEFGPTIIGNGYRPRDINRRVGGSMGSQHITFRALDLDLPNPDYEIRRAFYRWACRMWLEHGKALRMGLGLYAPWGGSRVHVDCGWRRRYWSRKYVQPILEAMR